MLLSIAQARDTVRLSSMAIRGTKDPLDGAKVVVELALCEKGKYPNGFWQIENEEKEPTAVPW